MTRGLRVYSVIGRGEDGRWHGRVIRELGEGHAEAVHADSDDNRAALVERMNLMRARLNAMGDAWGTRH